MMHESTFEYLKPTEAQLTHMTFLRETFADLAKVITDSVPESRYRSLAITRLEEAAMWTMKAVTRHGDGSPRDGGGDG
jgi:hypothetical protein